MKEPFTLQTSRLVQVRDSLTEHVRRGLLATPAESPGAVRCLPSWQFVPDGVVGGQAIVLDTGGTWVRALWVDLHRGVVARSEPWRVPRPGPLPIDSFLGVHASLIRELNAPGDLPIGWVWSFPAEATPSGDAKHIAWTKSFPVVGELGLVGEALARLVGDRPIRVLNDTVAALLAGATVRPGLSGWIGLVVGTGHNIAIAVPERRIGKLHSARSVRHVVNLESGAFDPGPLTEVDAAIDAADRPGFQRIEKAVAGYTMAELYVGAGGTRSVAHAGDVVEAADQGDTLADAVVGRSADLVAAAVAGASKHVDKPVRLVGEGSLFCNVSWRMRFQRSLRSLGTTVEVLTPIPDANALGAALAAVSDRPGAG